MAPAIEHVIVLVLENRSFDHMLGYLDHPDPRFDGLTTGGPRTNPGFRGGPPVPATPDAKSVLPVDPDHSHDAVMLQLGAKGTGLRRQTDNQGFVESYERKGRGLAPPEFVGMLAPVVDWWVNRHSKGPSVPGRGPLVMRCQPPEHAPVLATLAREFGICTRWFASVPGETWPNRNFLHAATSDGTTSIEVRFYGNRTIFEVLEEAGETWRIYYDDTPQVWAFRHLWEGDRCANWSRSSEFADHVRAGRLPTYSFIEPNHRPPFHTAPYLPGIGDEDRSSSQHPGNNLVPDAEYEGVRATGPGDFARADSLIADVYEALRSNPAVFERSILVVTYDEHGGLYDHVPPPTGIPAPSGKPRLDWFGWVATHLLRRKSKAFDFTMLGVRVPALVISPYVPAGTVSATPRDHASVPATLRALFAPGSPPLTDRDSWAPPFHPLLTLDRPRTDLPDLSAHCTAVSPNAQGVAGAGGASLLRGGPEPALPEHFQDLDQLAQLVDRELPGPIAPSELGSRARAAYVTREFEDQAERARGDG